MWWEGCGNTLPIFYNKNNKRGFGEILTHMGTHVKVSIKNNP